MATVVRSDVVMSWEDAAELVGVPLGEVQSVHEFTDKVVVTTTDGVQHEAAKPKSKREAAEELASLRSQLAMHHADAAAVPRIAVGQAPTPDTGKRDPGRARPEVVTALLERPRIEEIDVRTGAALDAVTGTPILDPKAAAKAERAAARKAREAEAFEAGSIADIESRRQAAIDEADEEAAEARERAAKTEAEATGATGATGTTGTTGGTGVTGPTGDKRAGSTKPAT